MHALKLYTRNKRIRRVLQRKAYALHKRNTLRTAFSAWASRTQPHRYPHAHASASAVTMHRSAQEEASVNTQAARSAIAHGDFVRVKGNINTWQHALRTPLRHSKPHPYTQALQDLEIQQLLSEYADSDLIIDPDNHLYRRVTSNE